jgi:hypothetical protein
VVSPTPPYIAHERPRPEGDPCTTHPLSYAPIRRNTTHTLMAPKDTRKLAVVGLSDNFSEGETMKGCRPLTDHEVNIVSQSFGGTFGKHKGVVYPRGAPVKGA